MDQGMVSRPEVEMPFQLLKMLGDVEHVEALYLLVEKDVVSLVSDFFGMSSISKGCNPSFRPSAIPYRWDRLPIRFIDNTIKGDSTNLQPHPLWFRVAD
ncbi:hypothetical protein OSB04_018918 [Centaurea solstitialis]|uniref:Uncharacterized protein n=1 Tax=Centaurea solstitialis TaxID=347529 RepID=A0AA38SP98_9ASTR|nr:hypothetical protein OSB04_018918 [Centaurea solstitialis]